MNTVEYFLAQTFCRYLALAFKRGAEQARGSPVLEYTHPTMVKPKRGGSAS
jgi:hypothetical protein